MAFKVESIQEMKSIADTLSQYSNDATNQSNKTVSAIEELDLIISGQGVDESLKKLKDSLASNTKTAVETLKYTSIFIKTQAVSYSQNEDDTTNTLNNVQSALDSIVI